MARSLLLLLVWALPALGREQDPPQGWRPTALPLAAFSSDEGAGYGLRVSLYRYDGLSVPYSASLSAQLYATNRGKVAHRLYLDLPHWRPGQRLEVELLYEKEDAANYYAGLSEGAARTWLAGVSPEERRRRSTFRQRYPRVLGMWLRDLNGPWQLRAGLLLGHCRVRPNGGPGNLLHDLGPAGREGGAVLMANTALRRDTRDDYNDPRRGSLAEILLEYGGLARRAGRGMRLSGEYRVFVPLPAGLILAQRSVLNLASRDLPFFELPSLGGHDTVRGLLEGRERAAGRLLANLELRWPGWAPLPRLPLRGGLLLFADLGQTFDRDTGPGRRGWRTGVGLGGRGHWHSTIVRGDLGRSEGRFGVYLKFAQVF